MTTTAHEDQYMPEPRTAESAAVLTLNALGYEWRGGEQWAPPIGKPPSFIEPEAKEWRGPKDGLPPKGNVMHLGTKEDAFVWIEVSVIGHGHIQGCDIAFFEYMCGGKVVVSYSKAQFFKPIPSERELWIERATEELLFDQSKVECKTMVDLLGRVYEAMEKGSLPAVRKAEGEA